LQDEPLHRLIEIDAVRQITVNEREVAGSEQRFPVALRNRGLSRKLQSDEITAGRVTRQFAAGLGNRDRVTGQFGQLDIAEVMLAPAPSEGARNLVFGADPKQITADIIGKTRKGRVL